MEKRQESSGYCEGERIALIACSKSKKPYSCPARDLYQGQLFKKSYRVASQICDYIYILSAKYGLVHPQTIIQPYNKTLSKFTKNEKQYWQQTIKQQMNKEGFMLPLIFFASREYCAGFDGQKPLLGLKYGECLSLLKRWEEQLCKKL